MDKVAAGAAFAALSPWRRTDARRAQGLPEDEIDRVGRDLYRGGLVLIVGVLLLLYVVGPLLGKLPHDPPALCESATYPIRACFATEDAFYEATWEADAEEARIEEQRRADHAEYVQDIINEVNRVNGG